MHAGPLLVELNRLIQFSPHIHMSGKATRISARFAFLLDILSLVLAKLLSSATLSESECASAAESLSLLAEADPFHHQHNDHYESLDKESTAHPGVRRCFFWRCVDRWRAEHPDDAHCFFVAHEFNTVLQLAGTDLDWLLGEAESVRPSEDKRAVVYTALRLTGGRKDPRMARLQQAMSTVPDLFAVLVAARGGDRWGGLRRFRHRWCSASEWKYWRLRKRNSIARKLRAWRERWNLLRHRHQLRSGRAVFALAELVREARGDESKYTSLDWEKLATTRGAGVATAVKAGCKHIWRAFAPPLPHEKPRPNEVDHRVVAGLAGIQSAIVDGELAFGSLGDDEARLLTRYAVNELNGFPEWLPGLAAARPIPVAEVLGACVLGEWQYPADREYAHDVLADLAWEGHSLASLVRPTVLELLRPGDPAHNAIREAAVTLAVRTTTAPDGDLAEIAASRCRTLPPESTSFPLWSAVCLQVNADQAIQILEERLPNCPTADDIVLDLCGALGGHVRRHFAYVARPDYLRPSVLERLIPLVYRHVRPAEDIDHADGEAYSATSRDDAAGFRGGLLTRLANSEEPDALASLRRLSVHPELSDSRDWILHLIDERMMNEADSPSWTPASVRAFGHERAWAKLRPDVVLVTVNRHETQAVLNAFQDVTGVGAVAVSLEDRTYHDLGALNGTRVVLALSGMGSGGVGAMQQTVERAIRALDPGAVIAVGIAFGVDRDRQKVGDILLSKQLRLYEPQRVGRTETVLRGSRPDASPRLLSHFEGFAQTRWAGAPVKSGLMLTGEKLVDNLDYRNELLSFESEAIGGEMEGSGLYTSGYDHKVDWVVLKAICDFADGNKGDGKEERQKLAAENAARFLVESLCYAPLKRRD